MFTFDLKSLKVRLSAIAWKYVGSKIEEALSSLENRVSMPVVAEARTEAPVAEVKADAPAAEPVAAVKAPAKKAKIAKKGHGCVAWFFLWWYYIPEMIVKGVWNLGVKLFDYAVEIAVWLMQRLGWFLYGATLLTIATGVMGIGLILFAFTAVNPFMWIIDALVLIGLVPFFAGLIWVPVHAINSRKRKNMTEEQKKRKVTNLFIVCMIGEVFCFAVPGLNVLFGIGLIYSALYGLRETIREHKARRATDEKTAA